MQRIKANYKAFIKWYETNPKIRTLRKLALSIDESPQRLDYAIKNNSFMKKEVVNKIVKTYSLSDEQKELFFFNVRCNYATNKKREF